PKAKTKSTAAIKVSAKRVNTSKVFIGLLGEKGSGRTYTWQKIFNTRVHTSKNTRRFFLDGIDYIEVFLINGSPIERKTDVKNILGDKQPEFVLCSLEYKPGVEKTIDFFLAEGYRMYIIYLKPGYSDNKGLELFEDYSLVGKLISAGVTVSIRSGKENPERRISEIRELALGWAVANDKLKAD
ncbi:MAG: hypothetical protein KKA07_03320, partial [Bacteroidetes bacterium]|nr:hypothetical protein [Bacteroidota bacterium]